MRTTSTFATSLVVVVTCAMLAPSLSHAQRRSRRAATVSEQEPNAAAPTSEAKEAARAAYTRGQSEFAAGRYDDAKSAFEAAFAAIPNPIVLLSIAEAEAKLGLLEGAIATLQRYLELRTDAPDRADVLAKIDALQKTPAEVSVNTTPHGAALDLDGLPTQKTTPTTLRVEPGDHEITYTLRGYQGGTEQLRLAPGEKRELEVTLEALETAPVVASHDPDDADDEAVEDDDDASGPPTTALWITGGIGAAGLITGTVLGFLAVQEHSDFESNPTTASADRGERLALFADVGFGIGAMAIVTAAVLYLTYDDSPDTGADTAKRAPSETSIALAPSLTPSSASATARIQF